MIPDGPAQILGEAGNSRIASQVATLTSANADLAAVNHAADARILELTAIVEMLERTLCGTRSERLRSDRLSGEQIAFVFDEIATAAKFRMIVTRRPKHAYRGRDGVIQASAPPHIIESGIPTEALLAQIAVAKYADGLPLYRQEAI